MTIPTRPAPPPPGRSQTINHHSAPAAVNKKPAPPRPPPPKALPSAPVKKSGSQKSISILSNLFGSKNSTKAPAEVKIPPKLPAPPAPKPHHNFVPPSIPQPTATRSDVQLINFDESPSSSPTYIKKSNTGGSDSMSMDSYCSSTSSPNNLGAVSQAESGFEDDFSVSDFKVTSGRTTRSTTFSSDPFDLVDDFMPPLKTNTTASNIRNVKPMIQPKPSSSGASFYACTSSIVPSPAFDDSLSNGKSLIKPANVSMPTIIKPTTVKTKAPVETKKTIPVVELPSDDSFDDDLPSPPMPSIPPPPPPTFEVDDDPEENSYAIALFDFESDVPEDLNLRANDKVYLIKQMNDEWMYGRNKRGCEGIFPVSYVEIRVPLKQVEPDSGTASRSASVSPAVESHRVRALYTFNAETDDDLTIQENEVVNVIYEINPEWLYGSNERGDYGQFPANFIEYVPQNLPLMPK